MWPRQRKTEIPGSNQVTHHSGIPWNMEGTLGMAQRQHLGSCKSIRMERERSERDKEEGWGICLTILLGRRWPGENGLSCFNTDTVFRSCLARGRCPCGLICSVSPSSSHGSLHVAGALMDFQYLTCAHTILVCLVLSWKEVQRRDPQPFRRQLLVSSGAFGTQQRVTLARVPQLLPQHLPVLRGSLWKRRSEEVGEETPSSLYRSPKMSWSRRGLEENFQTWDRMRRK